MALTIEQAVGQQLLLAFNGKDAPPPEISASFQKIRPAGVTLFRSLNIDTPAQVHGLTYSLQRAAKDLGIPPLFIATDQEGGQLMAIGPGSTPLPGNMALGAAGSTKLARQAGEVLGSELAAMGINLNYAPCCDVNVNPSNPVIGLRSFGEDPTQVAQMSAAMIAGIQASGVAATAKHFPGHGDTASDSHYGLPTVPHSLERLWQVELPPFRAAIQSGVKLVMTAHLALPAIDGPGAPPATLSSAILGGILRNELGFEGVVISDAMDMQAIRQGEALGEESLRAVIAGVDLLLLTSNPLDHQRIYASLLSAIRKGRLDPGTVMASAGRILALKRWLAGQPPPPDINVVGCAAHQAVAAVIAENALTLVCDHAGLLPLRLKPEQRMAVIIPRPVNLTPADTSAHVTPGLARALRQYHDNVDEYIYSHTPDELEIAALLQRARLYDLLILGTLNANTSMGQAELIQQALQIGIPTIVVALRLPYDLAAFPGAPTYLCTYSLLEPSMRALAKAMFGRTAIPGRLPVSIPGLYTMGHYQPQPGA